MENSNQGKACFSAPHRGPQPRHIAREAQMCPKSSLQSWTGHWRIPGRVCVGGLEHCNFRTSLGLMRKPPCYVTLVQHQLAQHLLALLCAQEISSLSEHSLQPSFKGFICSFFFTSGFFFHLSCNEQCWNVLGKELSLGKYNFSGASMDISEKLLRITGNLNIGTQPRSRVEASSHSLVNLPTEVKHFCCSLSQE